MSADLGPIQDGFDDGFAYGTISLTSGTSVELVDQSQNTSNGGLQAVYASTLIVPSGATLDLNGLNFYVTAAEISGTVEGGAVIQVGPPEFTADSPPQGLEGVPYSYQFQAIGTPPLIYSATGLPAWAQLNSTTGLLSGTPTADGTFDFSVTAADGIAPNATADVSIVVAGAYAATFNVPAETSETIPDGPYSGGTTFNVGAGATVTINGGTFTGGAVFNLNAGAVVDLTGGARSPTAGPSRARGRARSSSPAAASIPHSVVSRWISPAACFNGPAAGSTPPSGT